jgi:hypothetical protein
LVHFLLSAHGFDCMLHGPPQSTSDSPWFFTPSLQLAGVPLEDVLEPELVVEPELLVELELEPELDALVLPEVVLPEVVLPEVVLPEELTSPDVDPDCPEELELAEGVSCTSAGRSMPQATASNAAPNPTVISSLRMVPSYPSTLSLQARHVAELWRFCHFTYTKTHASRAKRLQPGLPPASSQ